MRYQACSSVFYPEKMPEVKDVIKVHYSPNGGPALVLETQVLEKITTEAEGPLYTFALPLEKFLICLDGVWALREKSGEDFLDSSVYAVFIIS